MRKTASVTKIQIQTNNSRNAVPKVRRHVIRDSELYDQVWNFWGMRNHPIVRLAAIGVPCITSRVD